MLKFQVFFWWCLLLVGTGSLASPQPYKGNPVEESYDLSKLLLEFSDATEKWIDLYQKFEKIQKAECSSQANYALCQSIRDQVRNVQVKKETDEEMNLINGVLSSIQEKVDKLDRKMESGVGGTSISTRDYINAMKGLERRLQYFQTAIMNLGRDVRLPMKYIEASEDDSLVDIDKIRPERASGKNYEYDDLNGIKHLGKTCKLLIGPYRKLLSSVDHLEEIVKDINSKDNSACALRLQKNSLYKNSIFKDIKDMLEDISDDIKSLRKMSSREMNENEKILKKINKKLEKELKDDDRDDENLKKSLKSFMVEQRKQLERSIKKTLSKINGDTDDDDDDDTDDSREKGRKDDTDDTDEDDSCDDSDGCSRKKGKDTDDSDDDDDDDSDDNKKGKGKRNDDDDDDDDNTDSDEDDSDDGDKKSKGKKKNRENLTKKYSSVEEKNHKDVEVLKNSAAGGPFRNQKFMTSLLGIPAYANN